MKTQLQSTGRILGIGIAAASAAFPGAVSNNARASAYNGTNAINFLFGYSGEASYSAASNFAQGIKDAGDNYTTGEVPLGADPMNSGATWNMMIPGSSAYGGLGALSGDTYFNASASYTKTGLVDSQGNVTSVSFTTPAGANFQSATWPSPNLSMNNEYAYSATPRGGTAPVATPIEDVIAGLTPGNDYALYLYGSGTNANNMGTTFSLDSSNAIAGQVASASTTGSPTRASPLMLPWEANSADYNYANANSTATYGVLWTLLYAQANSSGDINIYSTNLAGQNQSAFNGFQLQPVSSVPTPEPTTVALLGVAAGAGLLLTSRRKRPTKLS
jgi:hypothetical protein